MGFDTPTPDSGSPQAEANADPSKHPLYSDLSTDPDMLELIEMFVSDLPDRVTAIEQAVEQANLADLAVLSHQLKGAGGGYGFPSITEAAAVVEKQAKSQADLSAVQESLGELLSLCKIRLAHLTQRFAIATGCQPQRFDRIAVHRF